MSHIGDVLDTIHTPAPKKADITTAWNCYTTASKTARLYKSSRKNFSRRVSFAADLVAFTEETQHREVLEEVVMVQWQVFRCSPLWNVPVKENRNSIGQQQSFAGVGSENVMRMMVDSMEKVYDEKALKRYARVIASYVATHAVSGQDNPYKVELVTLKGLKGMRSDGEALKVTVHTTMVGEKKLIFTGILCGVEAAELQLKSNNCLNLPVFLAAGNVDTTERVVCGLEKCFDCVIAPLALPDMELQWMSAMWAGLEVDSLEIEPRTSEGAVKAAKRKTKEKSKGKGRAPLKDKSNHQASEEINDNEENEDIEETANIPNTKSKATKKTIGDLEVVKMTFQVPSSLSQSARDKIRHLTISFPAQQLKKVWDGVHLGGDSVFTETEMETFHSLLRNHIKTNFGINTEKLELIQISLPFFKAHQSGKVRIENAGHVKVVLRYLTDLCQGDMLQADPTLAVTVQDNCTMEWD
eukprot:GFUD01044313.1.p1 GENE.GFUD01044313.1~~GFUD01044313.1.p1  ORF type:complete len:469 (+),score=164.13 GFUD01044313.1:61-1467(+)